MSTIAKIATLIKQYMGLDMAAVGSALIERGVRERMSQLGQPDLLAYLHLLQSRGAELQELVELVVVPETWFFRDREAIVALARLVHERAMLAPDSCLRILSLPCSTGEEPYSIAMALLDAGVPSSQFHIDAIDISQRSLSLAQRGVYGSNSFRGKQLDFRTRHFTAAPDMPQLSVLSEDVRDCVNFRFGNMLDEDFLHNEAAYDFIFCRNVLIYFDRDVQLQAVDMLERLLDEKGCIFVGPAEAGILLRPHVEPIGIALTFGFRRKAAAVQRVLSTPLVTPYIPKSASPVLPRIVARPASAVLPVPMPVLQTRADLLLRAQACADRGELAQAEELCRQYLHNATPDAAVFCLQGLINDARQDVEAAIQLYRKAIYLQPDHQEALLHLAGLLRAQGDVAGALRLQHRAERSRLAAADKEQVHG